MVGVVSSIPSGGNLFFADFETPRCQFCTKMPEMSDLCYLGKNSIICADTNSQCYFVHQHLNNAWQKKDHWLTN